MTANGRASSRADKLAAGCTEPDEAGHVRWTGRHATSGAPMFMHRDRRQPASHTAFELRAGRPPVGVVLSECGVRYCLTGAHLSDEIERRNLRMQERAMWGIDPQPWDVCAQGLHTWDEHGRIGVDLTAYCRACNSARAKRSARTAKKGQTS